MEIPFLSLREGHSSIEKELCDSARRVIESGTYINGPETRAFASELESLLGVAHVVPVSNGLDALRLILRAYIETGRLAPGDEVMLPANTYIASVLPVVEFGLTPLLVRPDLSTYGLDWNEVMRLLSPKTKAVMAVHLYGTPGWDSAAAAELKERGILLIEDNAQAIGAGVHIPATGEVRLTGALGDAAAFSFYPTKNIGALGDAGAVATSDPEIASIVKSLANYGSTVRYHNDYAGYNCRMDELQAAFLRVKLRHLESVSEKRRRNAEIYLHMLEGCDIILPETVPNTTQVWHQFVIRHPLRERLRKHLAEKGISSDIHYPLSLFRQKCLAGLPAVKADRGEASALADRLAAEVLSLPVANVTEQQICRISDEIKSIHRQSL